ncbi:MAG: hypothetical protein H6563_04905 [Lewinellaceae bacterium]|nr:hypothetical protein [Lewinellaceae bacterium]
MADFDIVERLVDVFRRKNLSKDLPLSIEGPPRTKVEFLYQGVLKGEFRNDDEASSTIYKKNSSHPAYRKLKERLFEKLILQVFLLDISKSFQNRESRSLFDCYLYFSCNKILNGLSEPDAAYAIAKIGVKKALKNNLPTPGFLLSESNLILAKRNENYVKNYQFFKKTSEQFLNAMLIEIEISRIYEKLIISAAKGGNSKSIEVKKIVDKLLYYRNQIKHISPLALIHYFYALSLAYLTGNNFKEAIKTCDSALKIVAKFKISSIHIINLLKAQCHLHLNEFALAKKELKKGEKHLLEKKINRLAFKEIEFMIFLRSGAFKDLCILYESAISDPKFKTSINLRNESWRQHGLLLLLLIKLNKIPPSESLERIKPKLRLGKLMNEMPEFSKDKGGQNLAARILNVLILLTSKKFEAFEEALPPLQAYIGRYKRHYPEIFRCDLMVKMLAGIPKVHYDAERSAWRAREYLEKMLVPPEELPLKITEMEVIPYEKIWQFVVEFLETLKRRPYSSKFKS